MKFKLISRNILKITIPSTRALGFEPIFAPDVAPICGPPNAFCVFFCVLSQRIPRQTSYAASGPPFIQFCPLNQSPSDGGLATSFGRLKRRKVVLSAPCRRIIGQIGPHRSRSH